MTGINKFIGTSIPALQKVSKTLDENIMAYGKEEPGRLAQHMPKKNIVGALDENFIMDDMTLILMDPVSGYILAEQIEENRDAQTWHKVTQTGLKGLNVTITQLVGDEASGLTKFAGNSLRVMKGSDLFHIQQEITKGLTSHLARNLQHCKKKQEDLEIEKLKALVQFKSHLNHVEDIQDLSKKGINIGKRIIGIDKEEQANRKKIEIAEAQYKKSQEARRSITDNYHPFSLDTGEKHKPQIIQEKLEEAYATLEAVAKEEGCTDKQKQKLEKAKRSLGSMMAVLAFFFSFLTMVIKSMGLNESQCQLFEQLVSIQYLKMCLRKAKKKNKKEKIKRAIEGIEKQIAQNHLWREISESIQTEWWRRALECAQVFQRSSSCVEGRNGQLSLKFHAFRRINRHSLNVLTILHNFFIKRADETTAAERFFEQRPRDLFKWLLDRVELPRPRAKHKSKVKGSQERLAA
jgi:Family of unknown function (DUF6399)